MSEQRGVWCVWDDLNQHPPYWPTPSLQELEYDCSLCNVSEPLPPVYESVDEKLVINVNVSYATVAEREDLVMAICAHPFNQQYIVIL